MPGKKGELGRMFNLWRDFWKWVVISVLLTLISVAGMLLIPSIGIPLINEGIMAKNLGTIVNYGLLMLVVAIVVGACDALNTGIAVAFSEYTTQTLRDKAYSQIQELSFGNLNEFRTSDLLVRLTTDLQNVKIAVQQSIINLLRAPIMLVVATILTIIIAPGLAWIAIIVVVAVSVGQVVFLIMVFPAYEVRQAQFDEVNKVLRENMAGVRVVKAFVRQDSEKSLFEKVAGKLRAASLKPLYYQAYLVPALFFIIFLGIAGMYYFGGIQIMESAGLSIGGLTAAIEYLVIALMPIFVLVAIFPLLNAGRASLVRVYELVDTVPDVQDKPHPVEINPEEVRGEVVLDNVSFSYLGNDGKPDSLFLKDINLAIEPGEVVGFLGATGAGKSTLVNLIPRFYDVSEGAITIDGINVRDIPQDTLRQVVGICLQETVLFSGTIKDNILFGAPDATYDEMIVAAKAANAHDFISAIPGQYDGEIARKGANLSGGQRQRISIARALVRKPRVLILDDSTSACDLTTEARIQDAIKEMMKDTTQLIVAQRISSVITADKIVLLQDGEIVGLGNNEELLRSSELYQEIYSSQLGDGPFDSTGASNEGK